MFSALRTASGITLWSGDPDCANAYAELQKRLRTNLAAFLLPGQELGNRRKGNLGEYITLQVARENDFAGKDFQKIFRNADAPLTDASAAGLDLVYVYFSPDGDVAKDFVVIQEVKTTQDADLKIAKSVVNDYQKLFGKDPEFNLSSRIASIKTHLEFKDFEKSFLMRVERLAQVTPSACIQIRLYPTLVHEKVGASPEKVLVAVRAEISTQGWPATSIAPWSIALSDIEEGLVKLAQNGY
jgi:hypothetical protein